MTLGNAAHAHVRLIVWCRNCRHQIEPDPRRLGAALRRRHRRPRLVGPCERMSSSAIEMPASSAPKLAASAPRRGSAPQRGGGSAAPSRRRAMTLVPGSRPATRAASPLASASVTVASPTSGNCCSEATTTSLRQSVPERSRCPCMEMLVTPRPSEPHALVQRLGQTGQQIVSGIGHDLFP
jgi:hypothetical protein